MFFPEAKAVEPKKFILVRVWSSEVDGKTTNAAKAVAKIAQNNAIDTSHDVNVGHVSIETPNKYISLWPGDRPNSINRVVKSANNDLASDVEAEGHIANHTIYLYSLDVASIEAGFEDIQQSGTGWVLTGDSSLTEGEGHSCASLAYALLKRGGIYELLSDIDKSSHMASNPLMATGIISPNELANLVLRAKECELDKYPQTKSFHGSSADEPTSAGCRMM